MSVQPPPPPPTEPWFPTEEDLADWAKILIYDAYMQRRRQKCSREDFANAAIATLLALGWRSAFRSDTDLLLPLRTRAFPLPGIVEAMVDAGPAGEIDISAYFQRDNSSIGGGPE